MSTHFPDYLLTIDCSSCDDFLVNWQWKNVGLSCLEIFKGLFSAILTRARLHFVHVTDPPRTNQLQKTTGKAEGDTEEYCISYTVYCPFVHAQYKSRFVKLLRSRFSKKPITSIFYSNLHHTLILKSTLNEVALFCLAQNRDKQR